MKKIFLLIIFIFPFVTFSQNATKSQQNRSDLITVYVIDKLELSEKDAQFFKKIHLAQIVDNAIKVKESNASSNEEKRLVYRKGYENLKAKLTEQFGNKKAQQILKASNQARNK